MTEHRVAAISFARGICDCTCGEEIRAQRDGLLQDPNEPLKAAFLAHRSAANLSSRNGRAGYEHGGETQPHVRPAVCMGIRRKA